MRRSSRGPAILYCALTAVLVVLVAALAFTTRQPAPPQIAELTPQAQQQITRAPNQLSSGLGSAAGAGGGFTNSTSTTLPGSSTSRPPAGALPPIAVAAVHHCFGDPPRQIQDTQSPPCVAYWAGNNGGATSPGVTGTQIRVLLPGGNSVSTTRVDGDLQTFFNRYFEFYGRQMLLIPGVQPSESGPTDCSTQEAQADGMAEQYKPFAATDEDTISTCMFNAFARDHVVSVAGGPDFTTSELNAMAPYVWQYPMATDQQLRSIGLFVCRQLAGHDAVYSPDPLLASKPRKFGLLDLYEESASPPDTSAFTDELRACGAPLAYERNIELLNSSSSDYYPEEAQAVQQMEAAGVTTAVCDCEYFWEQGFPAAADAQQYRPEWVLAGLLNEFDYDLNLGWPIADQREALMGVSFEPPQVPYPDMTLNWALSAVDPGYQESTLGDVNDELNYKELLLIASGIQMAGPDLTPYTFERGLQAARFPNPFSIEMEGSAGFLGGSHSMTTDATVMWWSNATPSPYPDEGTGTWCYVDGAERFSGAGWAAPMDLFSPHCDSSPPGT